MSEQLVCANCKKPVNTWNEVWIIRWRCTICEREGTIPHPNPPIPKPAGKRLSDMSREELLEYRRAQAQEVNREYFRGTGPWKTKFGF